MSEPKTTTNTIQLVPDPPTSHDIKAVERVLDALYRLCDGTRIVPDMVDGELAESFDEENGADCRREMAALLDRFEERAPQAWERVLKAAAGPRPAMVSDERTRLERELSWLRHELHTASAAVGEAWFAGEVSLAEAITRKCRALEGLPLDEPADDQGDEDNDDDGGGAA